MRLPLAFTFLIAAATAPLLAQERPSAILVLDGSGSMWGQIDGTAKITIAQDVVQDLLTALPSEQSLGLTVYGHRRKGDCSDIETLVTPGSGTRDQIADAVRAIKPKGKTPMADAVVAAAQALRHTEEAATVILVSDGIETCAPDVCAVARKLEETGVNFTAHVVGFDVTDPEALAQMQCLADETGGTFRSAANASELAAALTTVAAAPPELEPEPEPITTTFRAVEGYVNTAFDDPVLWSLSSNGAAVFDEVQGNPVEQDLAEGAYVVTAYRLSTETELSRQFVAVGDGPIDVVVSFPKALPKARILAPDSAIAGSTLSVGWGGPNEANDNIQIGPAGEDRYLGYTYTADGNPLDLILPPHAGTYELRYVLNDRQVIATRPITLTEPELAMVHPDTVEAGSSFQVTWTGPDQSGDNIQIGPRGADSYTGYQYTSKGNPVTLIAPAEPGEYEIRYSFRDRENILRTPLTVTATALGLDFPSEVQAGQSFDVVWSGPDQGSDNIQIGPAGTDSYTNYQYTNKGNPVTLIAPAEPGDYEVRYSFRDRENILRVPLKVTAMELSLEFPSSVQGGQTIPVAWVGPNQGGDNIQIGPAGTDQYTHYIYTRDGTTVNLIAPIEPGNYEIRYSFRDRENILRMPVTVTEPDIALTAPETVAPGAQFQVGWTGPDQGGDNIQIGPVDSDSYSNYAYTRGKTPVTLTAPDTPGTYELRYKFRDRVTAMRQTIEVK
ncbi:von Willebrand factor type A domain protein [Falsiruegeria litorea R37]|uniref:von Willebrand factor type A domain protein n=1 Tax=Falsiruegeria litorea R37 TaxID=1200284 RepID=A0A1Y5SSX9_9RHOB|nr:VWA domain-containing protein [Falsiruegeria litorea]SLN44415.1 von Willebrand factor type A domain protein [Falsiruegeria litorea R37]